MSLLSLAGLLVVSAQVALGLITPPSTQEPFLQLEDKKVPVVLGVMSRCPDALLCESVFDRVLPRVVNKVDLSLTFIGTLNSSEPDFGVTCMHGRDECVGNVQELCAAKYAPLSNWWNFVHCQNYQGRYEVGKPAVALRCARSAKLDLATSPVGQCMGLDASGKTEEGVALLQASVQTTKEMGIEKSCTVIINGEVVCVRDGTWKQCENGHMPEDFIRQINQAYSQINGVPLEDLE